MDEKKADIVKVPLYAVVCPHCGHIVFYHDCITLNMYRELYDDQPCPFCDENIHLGKVVL